jgi:hypothetical protein
LAWDGKESEDDHFFTPPQSPLKKDNDYNVMLSTQSHLEVNGASHNVIMEEPTNLELFHCLGSNRSEHSNAKKKRTSKSIIKLGTKQPQFICLNFYGSKASNQIGHSHSKIKTSEPTSKSTYGNLK